MTRYKLLAYAPADGSAARAGVVIDDVVYDVGLLLEDPTIGTVEDVLMSWTACDARLAAFAAAPAGIAVPPVAEARRVALPPVARPGAIFCVGANYRSHVNRMAAAKNVDLGKHQDELSLPPYAFLKPLQSLAASGSTVEIDTESLDYEGELGIVIGVAARHVSEERAIDHIAGYIVGNDLSARDRLFRIGVPPASPFRCDWTGHKVFDGSMPIGSELLPARYVPDPQAMQIRTWVNGELRQDASTAEMIYSVARIVAYLSSLLTLQPGDMIFTGTPAGVASESGNFLRDGDLVEVAVDGVGTVVSHVRIVETPTVKTADLAAAALS